MHLIKEKLKRGTAILLMLGSCSVFADEGKWLQQYYDSRGVCVTSATVGQITRNESSLFVRLEVDPEYLARIQRGGEQIVRDWLALHCPLPLVAFHNFIGDLDVTVVGSESLMLSCKSFESSR